MCCNDIPVLVVRNCEECGIPMLIRNDLYPVFCDDCCKRCDHNPEFSEEPGMCSLCGDTHLNFLLCPEGK